MSEKQEKQQRKGVDLSRPASEKSASGDKRADKAAKKTVGGKTKPATTKTKPATPKTKPATTKTKPATTKTKKPAEPNEPAEPQRLQKALARAGVASRRVCEQLITQGRVRVNGKEVTELGSRVSPTDIIHVDGRRVFLDDTSVTMLLHKPAGVVSSMNDEHGRPDLSIYTKKIPQRLYHVGRLDQETEGLILLTNDGELAHRLQHPSYEIPKTYVAVVQGNFSRGPLREMLKGLPLEDGLARADFIRVLGTHKGTSEVEVTLHEGRNRIVRRMFAHLGFPVQRLVRTRLANLDLQGVAPGKMRRLNNQELSELMAQVEL